MDFRRILKLKSVLNTMPDVEYADRKIWDYEKEGTFPTEAVRVKRHSDFFHTWFYMQPFAEEELFYMKIVRHVNGNNPFVIPDKENRKNIHSISLRCSCREPLYESYIQTIGTVPVKIEHAKRVFEMTRTMNFEYLFIFLRYRSPLNIFSDAEYGRKIMSLYLTDMKKFNIVESWWMKKFLAEETLRWCSFFEVEPIDRDRERLEGNILHSIHFINYFLDMKN